MATPKKLLNFELAKLLKRLHNKLTRPCLSSQKVQSGYILLRINLSRPGTNTVPFTAYFRIEPLHAILLSPWHVSKIVFADRRANRYTVVHGVR